MNDHERQYRIRRTVRTFAHKWKVNGSDSKNQPLIFEQEYGASFE
jgi:hypothetical protein